MNITTDAFDQVTADHARMNEASAFVAASLAREALGSSAREPDMLSAFLAQRKSIHRSLHALITKAATTPLDTSSGLSPATPSARAFIGAVARISPLGQTGGVRVNGSVTGTMQTGNATASWAGESAAKPISSLSFSTTTLRPLKLIAQVVMTQELSDLSIPDALDLVQRSLLSATAAAEAVALLDPTSAAVAGVKPASVTNGLTPITPIGDVAANFGQVLSGLSGGDPTRPTLYISFLTASRAPEVLRNLREIGVKVIVTSAAGNRIVGVDADGLLISEGGVDIRRATHASVIMDTAPGSIVQTAGASPTHTSLWQADLVALRVERWINWTVRPGAAATLTLAFT